MYGYVLYQRRDGVFYYAQGQYGQITTFTTDVSKASLFGSKNAADRAKRLYNRNSPKRSTLYISTYKTKD